MNNCDSDDKNLYCFSPNKHSTSPYTTLEEETTRLITSLDSKVYIYLYYIQIKKTIDIRIFNFFTFT